MIKIIECYMAIIIIIIVTFFTGCEKETSPILTTITVSDITETTATSGGNISDDGGATVTARGVCWSTDITPTISDNKTIDGAGAGSFSSNMVDLFGGTTYFVRAYATNSSGTGYGMALSFKTTGRAPSTPTTTTEEASSIHLNSAVLNAFVNANYYSTVVTFEYGTTTNYGTTITATPSPLTGGTDTYVSATISGLTEGTTYHYRLKAVNTLGTTYGTDMFFTTLGQAPLVTTQEPTNVLANEAQLQGMVNANYLSTIVIFEYGTSSSYGSEVTAAQSPVTGNTNTDVSAVITNLSIGTIYHYRVKAVNKLGTTYGSDVIFTTKGQVPEATTLAATNITTVSAQLNGIINANYLSTAITFEYGTTTNYGSTITATPSPLTGGTNTNVSANITDLGEGTTYHYRIVATNLLGTVYSLDMTFPTLGKVPTVTALEASKITPEEAQFNGTVNANYLESTVIFEYGTTISYGNTVEAIQSPVTGNSNTTVHASITGLTYGTIYHYRVKAVNSLGTSYSSDMQFTACYTIGDNIHGGILFYIDGTGKYGLVCAESDQNSQAEWGCMGVDVTGVDGAVVGTGYQNTLDIINGCSTGIAAKICYDLDLNGYTDWFLPSREELSLMYVNLKINGLGNFANTLYWSSTEGSINSAWCQLFTSADINFASKNSKLYVRAVRAF